MNGIPIQGDAVSAWMMDLVAEEKAARKKEKISNFDLKSIIGIIAKQQHTELGTWLRSENLCWHIVTYKNMGTAHWAVHTRIEFEDLC